jgi:hypothetical protein
MEIREKARSEESSINLSGSLVTSRRVDLQLTVDIGEQ